MHPKVSLALPVAILLIISVLPATSAQEAPDLTFTGHEPPACDPAGGELLCWEIEGDLANAFVAGQEITIKVVGPDNAPHNLHFIADGEQDTTTYDTDGSASIANSDTVSGGDETTFSFTVPTDVEKLYYWCDVGLPVAEVGGDHELLGMRGTVDVNPAPAEEENVTAEETDADDNSTSDEEGADDNSTAEPAGEDADTTGGTAADNNTTDDGEDGGAEVKDSPLGGLVGLFAITGLAVAMRRRR